MAAPASAILDDFNRADSTGLGANWTVVSGFVDFDIVSTHAHDSAPVSFAFSYWNPAQFGPDSECYATVYTLSADAARVFTRFDPATKNGYLVAVVSNGTTNNWTIRIMTGGITSTLATFSQAMATGDKFAVQTIGATVYAWYHNGSAWSLVGSYDTTLDATRYTGAGYLAMESRASYIEDFAGGTIIAGFLAAPIRTTQQAVQTAKDW